MKHTPEFRDQVKKDDSAAGNLAACYARVFLGSSDGKRVLEDLRTKFGLDRLVFKKEVGHYDPLAAALTDGERRVMSEIENAVKAGSPSVKPTGRKQNP